MTESKLSALLGQSTVEPIVPEYDPVWDEAATLLKSNAIEPDDDSEAVARLVRAVKFDSHSRQFRNWVPFLLMVLASAVAFFAIAEAMGAPTRAHAPGSGQSLGGFADRNDARR